MRVDETRLRAPDPPDIVTRLTAMKAMLGSLNQRGPTMYSIGKRCPPQVIDHKRRAQEKSAVEYRDLVVRVRLIVGAAWVGLISEVADGFYLHRHVQRFDNPVDAVIECRAAHAALGGDRCDVSASVTLAAMDSERGPMFAGVLLVSGIALAFDPLRGSDLEWVDQPGSSLPKDSV
jgi:hypothetical protein